MKISRKFLNDFIDITDIKTQDLANELLLAGNEYESITKLCPANNLVVGYVESTYPHPNSDHLTVCKVNVGTDVLQILCGASNVKENIRVIVALVGATLPNDMTITKREIRGLSSTGMICSLAELGISNKFLNEDDRLGIHILPDDAPIGMDALKYLELDDEIIDFELTANRSDLMSILGFAYETKAVFNKELKEFKYNIKNEVEDVNNYMKVKVNTDKCPLYLGRVVKDVKIKESPNFIKERLMATGIRPINNIVDISNYVMILFGTPLHFFDLDKLNKNITVRMAKEDEEILTLDKCKRVLSTSDIAITSNDEIIGLAGVMGGFSTEILKETTNVFIEAATFDSFSIRKTAKKILKSEASNRFEKGIDKFRCYQAINYACYLLELYANGTVIKNTLIHDTLPNDLNTIEITLDKINSILGINLELEEVIKIFNKLSFKTAVKNDIIFVTVPSHRLDIKIKEDLIEEVGRINKMDNLISKMPLINLKAGTYEKENYKKKLIKDRLTALGLFEVITYTLIDANQITKFNHENYDNISILNPLTNDKKYLRVSLIPSLLNVYNYNYSHDIKDINIFELSNIYYNKNNSSSLLSILLSGNYLDDSLNKIIIPNNFYKLKGIIENLFNYLGLSNRYSFSDKNIPTYLHPYKSSSIAIDNKIIGYFGEIHPNINKNKVYALEINLDLILELEIRGIKNREISKYPSITKDLAIIVNEDIKALEIINTITSTNKKLLEEVTIFDIYKGEKIESGKISMAFKLKFSDLTKTLVDEDIMLIFEEIIKNLELKYNAVLRDK